MEIERKYIKIAEELRTSIDTIYCYDCSFEEDCAEMQKEGYYDCDIIRIKAIEKRLQNY